MVNLDISLYHTVFTLNATSWLSAPMCFNVFCLSITYIFSVWVVYFQYRLNIVLWPNILSNDTHVIYSRIIFWSPKCRLFFFFRPSNCLGHIYYIVLWMFNQTKLKHFWPPVVHSIQLSNHASWFSLHIKMRFIMCSNLSKPFVFSLAVLLLEF